MDDAELMRALDAAVANWNALSGAGYDRAESAADEFEASFYRFIDALRDWVNRLSKRPQTLEELLGLPVMREIARRLPEPLHLNLETEAELILENTVRTEEDKYD